MKAVSFRNLEKDLFLITATRVSNLIVLYKQHVLYSGIRLYSTTDQVHLEVRGFPTSLARKSCFVEIFFLIKPTRSTNFPNFILSKKLSMFQAFPLPTIRSFLLYIRHWYISCRFDDSFQQGQDETS